MRRFLLLFVTPTLGLLAMAMLPLLLGIETLFLRDVLHTHLPLKVAMAEALAEGSLPPLIDLTRGGGQPLYGNVNGLPFYPTNLLYLVGSTLWAFNAHFWIHLLLAALSGYWLGRAWELRRPAAWAVGAIYATSGYLLSLLNLFNLISGAALAPAFVAACLDASMPEANRRRLLAVGLLWTLLVLGGEPLVLLQVLALTATAIWLHARTRFRRTFGLVGAMTLGTLAAAPQIVETLRILPLSYRGYWQYSPRSVLAQSWNPATAIEIFVPFAGGDPLIGFWNAALNGGNTPLLFSLTPGLIPLLLLPLAFRGARRRLLWAWGMVMIGLVAALGLYNPLTLMLYEHVPGLSLARYPVKFWQLVTVGVAVLGGCAIERVLYASARRRLMWLGIVAALVYGVLTWLLITGSWPADALARFFRPDQPAAAGFQRALWIRSLLLISLTALACLASMILARNRRHLGVAVLLIAHVGLQTTLLESLYTTDSNAIYETTPPLAEHLPEGSRVVQGHTSGVLGPATRTRSETDQRSLARVGHLELDPAFAARAGLRSEFQTSPEGLDAFLTVALQRALKLADDTPTVAVLRASAIDALVADRPLDAPGLRPLGSAPLIDSEARLYAIENPAPDAYLATTLWHAPTLNETIDLLIRPDFDYQTAVVEGEELSTPPSTGPPGNVEILLDEPDRIELEVDSTTGGLVVVQRTYLPLYRVTVGETEVTPRVANFHRIGIEVPSGRHTVEIWADRQPVMIAIVVSIVSILTLGWIALAPRRRRAA